MTKFIKFGYIDKEKDRESKLGDHGVRKYDYEIGRFTSVDPLWEKYTGWTGYHYTRNNPINRIDYNGFAEYIDEKGRKISDGINDGLRIAVSSQIINDNQIIGENDKIDYDFSSLKALGYILPNLETSQKIIRDNKIESIDKVQNAENGGAGTLDYFEYGGKQRSNYGTGNASVVVMKAYNQLKNYGKIPYYYVHTHLDGSLNPTNIGIQNDYTAVDNLMLNYGILVGFQKVTLFRTDPKENLTIPIETFVGKE